MCVTTHHCNLINAMHICTLNLYYMLSQHVKTVHLAELACNILITYFKRDYDTESHVNNLLCDLNFFNQQWTLISMIVAPRIDDHATNI